MKNRKLKNLPAGMLIALSALISMTAIAQDELLPVIVEAESGAIGNDFSILQMGDVDYVTTQVNYAGLEFPGDTNRIITYQVSFADTGSYKLFARVQVGAATYSDDSFFAGRGFGMKDDSLASDWVMANGLAGLGYQFPTDILERGGSSGSQVWKWINMSYSFFPDDLDTGYFYVGTGNLTKTFQIASREDGLLIDKFAFGRADLYFRVADLDSLLPGSVEWPGDSSIIYPGPPLAQGSAKFLGNLKGYNDNNFAKIWNQLTPGNEGKWGSVATSADTNAWNWGGLDNLYNYSMENDLIFKDHTLIWGNQQPTWIETLPTEEQYPYIEYWIKKVGERYPDMDMIDVVNEALHDPPTGSGNGNYAKALGGSGVTGWDWVIKSFELARIYIPDAQLLINDYGIINDNSATDNYLTIINLLNQRGLIDGIGVQCHRFEIENSSVTTLTNNLDKLALTGLPIYISEMDLGNLDLTAPPDDEVQLGLYQKLFPVFWEHPSVGGVTLWGYEYPTWQETCHLVNTDGSWRPALKWLAQYIQDTPVSLSIDSSKNFWYYFEPECETLGENWEIRSDSQASNLHYVTALAELQSLETAPTGDENYIHIPFSLDSTDQYALYGRVKCPSTDQNSFWMKVDNEDFQLIDGLTASSWRWRLLGKYTLEAGDHELSMAYCENGSRLDKICVTNYSFGPSGPGEVAETTCDLPFIEPDAINVNTQNVIVHQYPNPFRSSTNIEFTLQEACDVRVQIFDIMGSEVANLLDENLVAGTYTVNWMANSGEGSKTSEGTYFYRISAGNEVTSGILVVTGN